MNGEAEIQEIHRLEMSEEKQNVEEDNKEVHSLEVCEENQTRRKTAADVVHLCTFCISNIKDLYEEVNRGYLCTLWHNLRR
jgi:hypothetical protein